MYIHFIGISILLICSILLILYPALAGGKDKRIAVRNLFSFIGGLLLAWSTLDVLLVNSFLFQSKSTWDLIVYLKTLIGGIAIGIILCLWILGHLFPRNPRNSPSDGG